ncbi:MAG TPA: response regulator [Gemmatimonadales bacterium]|nr:response regulator [Gemmatimonadales bacterium]
MVDESVNPTGRVLVVDDTEASRYAVARHLRHAGFSVDEAGSGQQALAQVAENRPDVVVLDVLLPDISGFEVARRLRADARFSRLPILHLSASFTDPDSQAAGLDGGADGYLTHPVEPVVLLASIRSLIRARAAEAEAVAAGEAWRATFQAITDGVCVVDAEARVSRWNDAFATLVGSSGLDGRSLADLLPGIRIRAEPPFLVGPDGLPPQATELALDGRWVRVTAQAMSERDGPPRHAVCVLTDVTKQRSAELRVQQVQRLEVAGQLAGGIAHEINNMMTVILGLTEFLARDHDLPAAHQRDLAGVRKAADRAADMARQLLAFSRRQVLQPRLVEVNTAIAGMSRLLRQLMGADREVTLTLSPDAGSVFADEAQLEQAILNLALNARDAMPSGGHFTITTTFARLDAKFAARYPDIDVRSGDYAHIALIDDGEGMTPETLDRVFEPFFTTKPVGQGTGLGLATVYGIVKQSNGYVWADSAPGQGTTFHVYLPQATGSSGAGVPLEETERPVRGSGTIMVVDDEPMVRALAQRALEAYGYTVLEAGDGREALRLLDSEAGAKVALVLADLVMPGMGGRELGSRLHQSRPGLPVLFMSAHTGDELARRRLLSPDIWFLQKPFTPDELVAQVQLRLASAAR